MRYLHRSMGLLALLCLLLAAPVSALELELEALGGVEYDSNIFGNSSNNESGGFALRFVPSVGIRDRDGRFTWRANYRPFLRWFPEYSEATAWSHIVYGEMAWRILPNLNLSVNDRFSRVNNLDLLEDELIGQGILDTPETDFGNRRTKRNRFNGNLTWTVTPADNVILTADHTWNEYSQETRGNTMLYRLSLSYSRAVSPRHRLGMGIAASMNQIEGVGPVSDRSSRFYNFFGSWVYQRDPTLTLSVSAGPTLVDGDEIQDPLNQIDGAVRYPIVSESGGLFFRGTSSCEMLDGNPLLGEDCGIVPRSGPKPNPLGFGRGLNDAEVNFYGVQLTSLKRVGRDPKQSATSLTWFADISLTKTWEKWSGSLSFRRTDATSFSSLGSATVANIFTVRATYRATERWSTTAVLTYLLREQENDVVGNRVVVSAADLAGCANILGTVICGPGGGVFRGAAEAVAFAAVSQNRQLDQNQYLFSLRSAWRWTERVTLSGQLSYRLLQENRVGFETPDRDRYRAALSINYDFDPINL